MNAIMSCFKGKELVSLLSETDGQIEKLTLLKPTSFQSQVFVCEIGHLLVWKDRQKERNRARKRSTGAIACPPTAPSVTGLSDSLMRFKMTGMWTPCCGKGSYFWY